MDETARAARGIKRLAEEGMSAYECVDGEGIVDLPWYCFEGRSGPIGKTFSGHFDLDSNSIRVDCAEDPTFWLEIDIGKAPHEAFRPGGVEAHRICAHFDGVAAEIEPAEAPAPIGAAEELAPIGAAEGPAPIGAAEELAKIGAAEGLAKIEPAEGRVEELARAGPSIRTAEAPAEGE